MYYDKSMKRTVLALCVCWLPIWVAAQSTCETRVDAHPHASTPQRVDYCLNETYEAIYNNPGLVFSGVTTRHPVTQPAPEPVTAQEGNFKWENVTVNQDFVETRQFPKLTDGRISQQEIWAKRRAAYQAQQMGRKAAEETACELQEEKPVVANTVHETKAGLKARTKKPGRRFVQALVAQREPELYAVESSAMQEEVAPVTDEYTYDNATVQPYTPATPDAQEYVPATPDAQEYIPAEQPAQPYTPYAPAN